MNQIDTLKKHVIMSYSASMVPFEVRKKLLKYRTESCKCIRYDVLDHKQDDDLCRRFKAINGMLSSMLIQPRGFPCF